MGFVLVLSEPFTNFSFKKSLFLLSGNLVLSPICYLQTLYGTIKDDNDQREEEDNCEAGGEDTPSVALDVSTGPEEHAPGPQHGHTILQANQWRTRKLFRCRIPQGNPKQGSRSLLSMGRRFGVNEDGRIEVDCNEEGVLFVEAESGSTIDDFGDFAPSKELKKLVPAVDYSGGISSYFLMVAQITYFKCGGAALGIATEHHMADGPSAFHFLNSWSEIARGLEISIPPFLDRTLLAPRDPPQPKFNHIEYQPPAATNKKISYQNNGEERHHFKTSIFKMTKDQLNTMKSQAKNYSTFELSVGHIWRCVCKARKQPYDQETTLFFPVGGRTRLEPNLPPGFFGNAYFAATSTALVGDLQSKPLSDAASLVHESLAKTTNDYLRSAIDYLELQPDITALRRRPSDFQCPNLGITSWSKMGMYDADFGWGRPCYMGPAGIMFEGKSYILPSASGDGSLSLAIALRDEHMTAFEKLFHEYV